MGDIMRNDENIDLIYSTRIPLTERSLEELCDRLERKSGVPIRGWKELKDDGGYVFYGDYKIPVGDVVFDTRQGTYRGLSYRIGSKQQIEAERKKRTMQERKQRKLKVQRNRRIGVAIAAAGMIALASYGVVHLPSTAVRDVEPVTVASSTIMEEKTASIVTAEDLLLIEWANYAIGEVSQICSSSPYEAVSCQYDIAYPDYFAKVMQSYYGYLDYLDQEKIGFPADLIASSKENAHTSFRSNAIAFDEYLENNVAFRNLTFSNSPYAYSILVDKDGKVVTGESGVVIGEDGQVVTIDDTSSYDVYIKASVVPGAHYTLTNLPEDAILVDGEAYIDSSHLHDVKHTFTK